MSNMKENILIAMFNSVLIGAIVPIEQANATLVFGSDERIRILDINQEETLFELKSTGNVCTDAGIIWEVLARTRHC